MDAFVKYVEKMSVINPKSIIKNISLIIGVVDKIMPTNITAIAQNVIVRPVFIEEYILSNKGALYLFNALVVRSISVSTE